MAWEEAGPGAEPASPLGIESAALLTPAPLAPVPATPEPPAPEPGFCWFQRSLSSRAPALEATSIRAGQRSASWRSRATRLGFTWPTTTFRAASAGTRAARASRKGAAKEAPGGCTSTGGTGWPAAVLPAANRKLLALVPRSRPYSTSKRRRCGLRPRRQVRPGSIGSTITERPVASAVALLLPRPACRVIGAVVGAVVGAAAEGSGMAGAVEGWEAAISSGCPPCGGARRWCWWCPPRCPPLPPHR